MGRDGLIKRLKHFCHSFFRYYSASTRAFTFNLSLSLRFICLAGGGQVIGEKGRVIRKVRVKPAVNEAAP